MPVARSRRGGLALKAGAGVAALVVVIAGVAGIGGNGGEAGPAGDKKPAAAAAKPAVPGKIRHVVKRENLTLSALAGAALKTKNTTQVVNQLETAAKIVWVVEEGTRVRKGDKLIELDSADLQDQLVKQKIRMADVLQKTQQAESDLAIARSKSEADAQTSANKLKIAELDLRKYVEGDYQQTLRKAESAVAIAQEELRRAKDRLDWTRRLAEKNYVTQNDLEGDEFAVKKSEINLASAEEDLKLLQEFTYERTKTKFETDVADAKGDLERITLTNQREIETRLAALDAAKSTADLEAINTRKIEEQLARTVIRAPEDGMVVFYKERWRGNEPVMQIGSQVNPRQRLIDLPDFSAWMVEARVHESQIQQIAAGQKAFVSIDAFPERLVEGRVSKISVLPDESRWYRDTQEYLVEIELGENLPAFKPGMSAKAEIILGSRQGVLAVPIQAVAASEGKTTVWAQAETGPEERPVKLGVSNDRLVEVLSGLTEGETVFLDRPAAAGTGLRARPSERASEDQLRSAGKAAKKAEKNGGPAVKPSPEPSPAAPPAAPAVPSEPAAPRSGPGR